MKATKGKRRARGLTTRQARVRRLRERLKTERDPKTVTMIEAQLRAFDRNYRPDQA